MMCTAAELLTPGGDSWSDYLYAASNNNAATLQQYCILSELVLYVASGIFV